MKIERVVIKNYKSIKEITFDPNPGLNAFIGANSSGKSNIFDAINWVLGYTYPTFNAVKKEDHFLGDDNNKIFIQLHFDDGNFLELNEHKEVTYNGKTEIKSGLFLNDNSYNCKGEIREKYAAAYLGVDRKILDYLPSNRWSLVGRILQEVNKKFLQETYIHNTQEKKKTEWLKEWLSVIRDRLLFTVKDDEGREVMQRFLDILKTESANQLNKTPDDFNVDLSLYDPWNFYKTLQLIVKEDDMGIEFRASELGMGVQASISIAILKAYSEISLSNKTPIFIDEPELYLHPQAQRNFYKILRNLAKDRTDIDDKEIEGTQVFYTTHSANFLSAGSFDEIFLVRKSALEGTCIRSADVAKFIQDLKLRKGIESSYEDILLHYKNAYENTGDTQKANEAFFAKRIVLVEGASESLTLPYLFDKNDFDYIKEGISIVACGGKSELDRFYRLYSQFGIPCYIIFDGDKSHKGTAEEDATVEKNKELLDALGESPTDFPDGTVQGKYLGFIENFETALGSTKKGLDLYKHIREEDKAGRLVVPDWVAELQQKIMALPTTAESVLKS